MLTEFTRELNNLIKPNIEKVKIMFKMPTSAFIVDDDPFHLEVMKQLLRTNHIDNVKTFQNGMDCLQHIHSNPEVVFLDHYMDIYSGYDTLRKIKRYNPNIFVVMVSAQEDIDTAVATLKYGAFDYVKKDDEMEQKILDVLKNIADTKELLKERKPTFLKRILKFI